VQERLEGVEGERGAYIKGAGSTLVFKRGVSVKARIGNALHRKERKWLQ